MKTIELTKGQVTLVDDEDFESLSQHKWCATYSPITKSFYAVRTTQKNLKKTTVYMHAIIMDTPKGFHTDHIDGNTLDNRRENLRVTTPSVNLRNRRKYHSN